MSRFGVMKHLGVLTEADLVVAVKDGRSKRLFLNPVPIEQVANRWISKYAARFTSALVGLQEHVEGSPTHRRTRVMTITAHVYQIHINADADLVWAGDHAVGVEEALLPRHVVRRGPGRRVPASAPSQSDGGDAIDGMIEEMTPPGAGAARPVRADLARALRRRDGRRAARAGSSGPIEQVGERLTRVRLVHGDLADSPLTWANVKDGWVWVLDALKTVLETGRTLPRVRTTSRRRPRARPRATGTVGRASRPTTPRSTAARRRPATLPPTRSCSGSPTPRRTTGSARAVAGPENDARGDYLVSRALTATGQPDRGLVVGRPVRWRAAVEHGLADFDLAYAHEARARALHALGRADEAAAAWRAARAVEVADPEDRAIVESDFAALAPVLG